jgi:hypothetical protein
MTIAKRAYFDCPVSDLPNHTNAHILGVLTEAHGYDVGSLLRFSFSSPDFLEAQEPG